MNLLITVEAGKRSGQPCVRAMRITVRDVLEYLAGGMSLSCSPSSQSVLQTISELVWRSPQTNFKGLPREAVV